jgi:hypothetical protein
MLVFGRALPTSGGVVLRVAMRGAVMLHGVGLERVAWLGVPGDQLSSSSLSWSTSSCWSEVFRINVACCERAVALWLVGDLVVVIPRRGYCLGQVRRKDGVGILECSCYVFLRLECSVDKWGYRGVVRLDPLLSLGDMLAPPLGWGPACI